MLLELVYFVKVKRLFIKIHAPVLKGPAMRHFCHEPETLLSFRARNQVGRQSVTIV